jgi:hypothetical protein
MTYNSGRPSGRWIKDCFPGGQCGTLGRARGGRQPAVRRGPVSPLLPLSAMALDDASHTEETRDER